ncbi:MAG TPA: hypothetical protein VHS74_16980 [Solirubrobacterales bacterium]|jgi:hypothetical protein|nr:hypothetical protein [Solirubrobacterales bacterium]
MEASPADEDAVERDTADDWRIEPQRSIATVAELEGRIDVALATARTAEEAALEIGAASLEAAEQARRAAALAERASASAARAASEVAAAPQIAAPPPTPAPEPLTPVTMTPSKAMTPRRRRPDPFDERLTAFRERAENVMIRLQKLEAGTPPGDGPTEVVRLR